MTELERAAIGSLAAGQLRQTFCQIETLDRLLDDRPAFDQLLLGQIVLEVILPPVGLRSWILRTLGASGSIMTLALPR